MKIENADTHGTFCYEIKNRFRCIVEVNGSERLCYVASSSKLSNFIELEGVDVWLLPKGKNASSTEYTLFSAEVADGRVLLELSLANTAIEEQLHRRYFSFLGKRKNIHREKTVDGYKADLYIEDTDTLVEIKTVISTERTAIFPSVYSERSIIQLKKVLELLERNHKVCYLFAILHPGIRKLKIDSNTEFYKLFIQCVEAGMLYKACKLKITENEISVEGIIDVDLDNT